jgi:hypothetical protein
MYLKRHKTALSSFGLFQASKIKNKSTGLLGIRTKGYFLSLLLCMQLKETLAPSKALVRKFNKPKVSSQKSSRQRPLVVSSEPPASSQIPVQAVSVDVLPTSAVQYPSPVGYFNPYHTMQFAQSSSLIQCPPQVYSIPQSLPQATNPPIIIYIIN